MKNAPNPAKKPFLKVSQSPSAPAPSNGFGCISSVVLFLLLLLCTVAELYIVLVVLVSSGDDVTFDVVVVIDGVVDSGGVVVVVDPSHVVLTSLHVATAVKLKIKLSL